MNKNICCINKLKFLCGRMLIKLINKFYFGSNSYIKTEKQLKE